MKRKKITAIILAAVFFSKSELFDPLLKLGGTTVLDRLINTFRDAGVNDIIVVLNERTAELAPALAQAEIHWVIHDEGREGMISSLRAALAFLEAKTESFFLSCIEIPLVRRTTLRDIIFAYEASGKGIAYPTFSGERGLPILITAEHAEKLSRWNDSGELNAFLEQFDSDAINVKVSDENIFSYNDSQSTQEALIERWKNYHIPSSSECISLLTEKFAVNEELMAHSRKVANLAVTIARALNTKGYGLNLKLIEAAGLLHDIARGKPDHASIAASLLREIDYPAVAEIVEAHMNPMVSQSEQIGERDVVCFADKLVQGNCVVPLETRFQRRLDHYADDPKARAAIEKKLSNAKRLRRRIETALGEPIESSFYGFTI